MTRRNEGMKNKVLTESVFNKVINYVSIATGVDRAAILGRNKSRKYSRPRQIAQYILYDRMEYSGPQIGAHFDRDHTTIIHASKLIEHYRHRFPEICLQITEISRLLGQDGPKLNSYAARVRFADRANIPLENIYGLAS